VGTKEIKSKEKDNSLGLMEKYLKELSMMVSQMVQDLSQLWMVQLFMGFGLMDL
jgi:hypothetical protein